MRSLIIGSSGGIGAALTAELAGRGEVVGLSRSGTGLDVTEEKSVADQLGSLEGPFDLVFCTTGALGTPEKSLRAFTPEAFLEQMQVNALGPMLVLKHALRLMPRDRRSVFAALSARVGSVGDNHLGGWYSYRSAKAALNQLIHGAAVEVRRSHPQAVLALLHPGTVATGFTRDYPREKLMPEEAARRLLGVLEDLPADQSGCFRDWRGAEVPW